jgi:hypothetical protein
MMGLSSWASVNGSLDTIDIWYTVSSLQLRHCDCNHQGWVGVIHCLVLINVHLHVVPVLVLVTHFVQVTVAYESFAVHVPL